MDDRARPAAGGGASAAAWGVHLFTSLGVVVAFLALLAIERGEPREALLWLVVALFIDGVDGTLARAARVSERLPRIDGSALDLVIDYLTYVFLPVLLIWRGGYLPDPWALPLCAAILSSSLYVFARRDMKTDDGYFRGFPGLWNVIAFYFFVLDPAPAACLIVVVALVVMTFAPVHVVHPFRARDYRPLLLGLTVVWTLTTPALLVPALGEGLRSVLAVLSVGSAALLIALGLLRTARGARPAPQ
jgi:phosphatidylcholine synthase